jgi:hypothetical protein
VCDCGSHVIATSNNLRTGNTLSCGCLQVDVVKQRSTTHGHTVGRSTTPEYRSWAAARNRSENPNFAQTKDYSDRGIKMCKEWADSFEAFLAYIGPKPARGLTLERMDNDKGYEPGNVKWATRAEQNRNRRKRN